MKNKIDFDKLVRSSQIKGDDDEDTELLLKMLTEARLYITSQKWCARIQDEYFGLGVGGLFAVFLFRVEQKRTTDDEWLWVIVGDLPSAYIVVDRAPVPIAALVVYVELMSDWVEAVEGGGKLDEAFPVTAEPTVENARNLKSRLNYLRREFLQAATHEDPGRV